jgi:hypothetical protein
MPVIGSQAGTVFPNSYDTLGGAYDPNIGPAVTQMQFVEGCVPTGTLTNVTAQSIPDITATSSVTLTAGTVVQTYIGLRAGQTVTNLSIITAATAASTPTNQWAGLAYPVGTTPKVVAVSADGTTAAIAANTVITFAMGTPYVVPVTGWYLAFVCVAATTGPTAAAAVTLGANGRGTAAPWLGGPGGTGKTTVPAVGATLTATTAAGAQLLVYAN